MIRNSILLALSIISFAAAQVTLPASFDSRTAFASCMHTVNTQGDCGSCYAFSATGVLTTRSCIFGKTELSPATGKRISPQTLISCTPSTNDGCDGGFEIYSWQYLANPGAPSCESNCNQGCMPYTSSGCSQGSDTNDNGCRSCPSTMCYDGSRYTMYRASSYGQIVSHSGLSQEQAVMLEIYRNGPVQTCFEYYSNFNSFFKSNPKGVYTTTSGKNLGGHCVEIIGWGVDGRDKYWLMTNTWGPNWAMDGHFKFKRGNNLCHAEEWSFAGCPAGTTCSLTFASGKRDVEVAKNNSQVAGGRWTFLTPAELTAEFGEELVLAKSALAGHLYAQNNTLVTANDIGVLEGKVKPATGVWLRVALSVATDAYVVDVIVPPAGSSMVRKVSLL